MPDEQVPFMQRKVGGIPVWIIVVGGVALLAYMYFQHQSSAAATTSGLKTTSGSGSARTGKITVQKGAVSINVKQGRGGGEGDDDDEDNDQPKPKTHPRIPTHHKRPNPYDVPHSPRRITEAQARYAMSHNRPVYTKGGKNGWTKQSKAKSGTQYWVGGEVYDWLRDAGQIKGANQGA